MSIESQINALVAEAQNQAWDAGYLAGVEAARARPAEADEIVQDILAYIMDAAFSEQDEASEEGTTAKVNAQSQGAEWPEGLRYADADEALQAAWAAYDRQVFRD
jgi:hypothetical protein